MENFIATPASEATRYINYSEKEKILEVEFILQGVFQYLKVPRKMWEEYQGVVLSGGSSGVFVNQRIKTAYDFRKVTSQAKA